MEFVNVDILHDYLAVGVAGFVMGVVAPMAFRVIGYIVDTVKLTLKGCY